MNTKSQKPDIFFITGAPGSGKTTTIDYLLRLKPKNIAFFDIDSIINEASELAGKDIHFAEETWVPFRKIWANILKSVVANGITPVLFVVSDKEDFENLLSGLNLRWIAIDCEDDARIKRLKNRKYNYSESQIAEIIEDAKKIRARITDLVDSSKLDPEEVAEKILSLMDKEKS